MSKPRTLHPHRFTPLAYRVDDVAIVIGVSASKVWDLIREGRLPARKLDGSTIVRYEDLAAFVDALPLIRQLVEAQETPPPPPLPSISRLPPTAPPRRPKTPPPALSIRPALSPPLVPTATYRRSPLSPDKILRMPTPGLATVIGPDPIRRPDAMAKLWSYIRAHGLQAEADRRVILADSNLLAAFGLQRVSMHDLNRLVKKRLSPSWDDPTAAPRDTLASRLQEI